MPPKRNAPPTLAAASSPAISTPPSSPSKRLPRPSQLIPTVELDFTKALTDPDSINTPGAFSRFEFQVTNKTKTGKPKTGVWTQRNTKQTANARFVGVVRDAEVGPYGYQNATPPDEWTKKTVGKIRHRVNVHMPALAGTVFHQHFQNAAHNLWAIESNHLGVPREDMSRLQSKEHNSFLRTPLAPGPRGHSRRDVVLPVVWNIFEDQSKDEGAGASMSDVFTDDIEDDDATASEGTDADMDADTVFKRRDRDPRGLIAAVGLSDAEKKQLTYRADLGVSDKDSKSVGFDQLPQHFFPGVAVVVDVSLRYFYVHPSRTYQLYVNAIQALGPAFDTIPLSLPSPSKRKADDDERVSVTPSPKKKPLIRTGPFPDMKD